jgi:ferric-dicitrate binding protein FerR (iron transport regulator)
MKISFASFAVLLMFTLSACSPAVTVGTERDGRTRVIVGGSTFILSPESELTAITPQALTLRYGRVRARASPPDLEIRTANAGVSTSGGDVYIEATVPMKTLVVCLSGKVHVKPAGSSAVVALAATEALDTGVGQKRSATADELKRAAQGEAASPEIRRSP